MVGPRYTNGTEQNNNGYTATPYTPSGELSSYEFDISVYLNGGMPLQDVRSNTHAIEVQTAGQNSVDIILEPSETKGGNKDFILEYSYSGNAIESGVLLYEDGEEQFFLCMAQPPKQVAPEQVPDREYIFVMDVSGSMNGFPLEVSKNLMNNLVNQLKPTDRFNVLFFAGASNLWQPNSALASPENLEDALNFMQNVRGGGGTELLPALQRAMNLPRQSEGLARSVVIITDGYVSVENEAFELIRSNLNQSNVFTFGIGSSVNRHLIEGLAHAGKGVPFIVTNKSEAFKEAQKLKEYIQNPVMTQIEARFPGLDVYDVEPSTIPDVLAERPVIIFGKYKGQPKGEIYLEGTSMQLPKPAFKILKVFAKGKPAKPKRVKLDFSLENASNDERNKAIKYLWAREKIRNKVDFNGYGLSETDKQEVTRLGLKYNLLTPFTSFIAVEKRIVNTGADSLQAVKQPLPMPENVEDSALGFHLSIQGLSNLESLGENKKQTFLIVGILLVVLAIVGRWLLLYGKSRSQLLMLAVVILAFSSCNQELMPKEDNPYTEVTFILGEDASQRNPYYHNAFAYFSSNDVEGTPWMVTECRSILELREWLANYQPRTGAWKKINIVAHGNQWTGINVPVVPEGERASKEALQAAMKEKKIKPLPNSVLDQHTQISIFGCNVGQDTSFLETLAISLGGKDVERPSVASAPYFNVFENHQDSFSRHLAETYFVAFPAGSFPGNKKLAQQLRERYPDVAIDWKKALLTLEPQEDKRPYVHYFHIPVEWGYVYGTKKEMPILPTQQDTLNWVSGLKLLQNKLSDMEIPMEQFRWTIKEETYKGHPVRVAFGQTIIYCILKPITDANQEYVQAATDDRNYYTIVD